MEEGRKKDQKIPKKTPTNSTIKPQSTISLQCMKYRGATTAADAHDYKIFIKVN